MTQSQTQPKTQAAKKSPVTSPEDHVSHIAKVTEVIACSEKSIEDAIQTAVAEFGQTIRHITGVEVLRISCPVKDGEIVEYRADLKIAFGVERSES